MSVGVASTSSILALAAPLETILLDFRYSASLRQIQYASRGPLVTVALLIALSVPTNTIGDFASASLVKGRIRKTRELRFHEFHDALLDEMGRCRLSPAVSVDQRIDDNIDFFIARRKLSICEKRRRGVHNRILKREYGSRRGWGGRRAPAEAIAPVRSIKQQRTINVCNRISRVFSIS